MQVHAQSSHRDNNNHYNEEVCAELEGWAPKIGNDCQMGTDSPLCSLLINPYHSWERATEPVKAPAGAAISPVHVGCKVVISKLQQVLIGMPIHQTDL